MSSFSPSSPAPSTSASESSAESGLIDRNVSAVGEMQSRSLASRSQVSTSSSKSKSSILKKISRVAHTLEPMFLKQAKISLHEDGRDNGGHGHHDSTGELKASMSELFYDLIFVVVMIRLAEIIKYNFGLDAVYEVFLIFTVCWLTWFHLNMLMTRFKLPSVWQPAIYLIMLFTLGFAIEVQGPNKTAGLYGTAFHVSLLCSRVGFILVYTGCIHDITISRPMIKYYFCFLGLSVGASAVAIAATNRSTRLYCTIGITTVELMMYPLTLEVVSPKKYLTINVEHLTERSELWVILILGESIISMIMLPDDVHRDTNFYLSQFFAFTISYLELMIMIQAQPQHADDPLDTHALDYSARWGFLFHVAMLLGSFGIFCMGVGFKLLMAYGVQASGALKQTYALFLTCSISATYVVKCLSRLTHQWTPFDVWGFTGSTGVRVIELVQLLVGLAIAPLGLLVSYAKVKARDPVTGKDTGEYVTPYEYERTGLQTWELLACITPIVALLLWLEYQLQMPTDIIDLYFQFCNKMQIEIKTQDATQHTTMLDAPTTVSASKWGTARTGIAVRKTASPTSPTSPRGEALPAMKSSMFQSMVSGMMLSSRRDKYRVPGADSGNKGIGIATVVSAILKVRRNSASGLGSQNGVNFHQVCDLIDAEMRRKVARARGSRRKSRRASVAPLVVIPGHSTARHDLDVTEV